MKRILLLCLFFSISFTANMADAQSLPNDVDPQTAQAIQAAMQKGDTQTAKKIYEDSKTTRKVDAQPARPVIAEGQSFFEKTLPGGLAQFGYDLFNATVSTFNASATMPVGPDYVIGSGDHFTLTLWGTTEGIYSMQVSKEGNITLPKVGVVSVAGLKFGELEGTLRRHLSKYYSNFNLSIAMGGLKAITVYVVGEVSTPGSYSLSSLTTVYGALFSAGGPTKKGTLRKIQVLRSGKVIKIIDLYDFLLKGDRSQDIKLQNDDTVFVPLIGPIAGISGGVYRPAIYELKGQENISDLIMTAGGIMPVALGGRLQLIRYSDNLKKVIQDIKIDKQQSGGAPRQAKEFTEKVQNMDSVIISPVYEKVWETVELDGAVEHPGGYQWRPDLKVREIIFQGKLLPTVDMKRAEVIRITGDMIERKIIPIDLAALMAGDDSQNIRLDPKDKVRIYSVDQNPGNMWETVSLTGVVRNQGNYQWKPGLRLREIIVQGQLLPSSDLTRADLIRLNKNLVDRIIIPLNLSALMAGDESQNIPLEPQDLIRIYSQYKPVEKVIVSGSVVRAGEYEINRGERMSDLLRRVGGFSSEAYPFGAVFKRVGVKNAQAQNLQVFITKMQSQLLQTSSKGPVLSGSTEEAAAMKSEMLINQGLLENLKSMQQQFEGRVSINITENIASWAGSKDDLLLQDGDSLAIPKRPQEVMVMGEVRNPSAQVYQPELRVKDYLNQNGGFTDYAAENQIFVVQANGFAVSSDTPSVGNVEKITLHAGDTIIVPQKVERYVGWRWTKEILDVVFKLAVTAATLNFLF